MSKEKLLLLTTTHDEKEEAVLFHPLPIPTVYYRVFHSSIHVLNSFAT